MMGCVRVCIRDPPPTARYARSDTFSFKARMFQYPGSLASVPGSTFDAGFLHDDDDDRSRSDGVNFFPASACRLTFFSLVSILSTAITESTYAS